MFPAPTALSRFSQFKVRVYNLLNSPSPSSARTTKIIDLTDTKSPSLTPRCFRSNEVLNTKQRNLDHDTISGRVYTIRSDQRLFTG
eukprot:753819-Hanusia_phi.AAC.2